MRGVYQGSGATGGSQVVLGISSNIFLPVVGRPAGHIRISIRENWNSRSFAKWVRLGRVRLGNYIPSASRVGTTLKLLTNFQLTSTTFGATEVSRLSPETDFPKPRHRRGPSAPRNEDIFA